MAHDKYGYQAYVTSELYVAGRTDDGEDYTAERYLVAVEFDNGMRYVHGHTFPGCVRHVDPEDGGQFFEDVREAAEADANKLVARINAHGSICLDHWHEFNPVYGSKAYVADVATKTKLQLAGEDDWN